MKTVLLMSGGVDSTSIAHWKKPDLCLTVNYGQKSALAECEAARQICGALKLPHNTIETDCSVLGSGEMSNYAPIAGAPIPEWWPFRNQLLITLAATYAAKHGFQCILVGAVKSDSSHKDGTKDFFSLIDSLISYQELSIRVDAPALTMESSDLVKISGIKAEHLILTHSCHNGNIPCSRCRGCQRRYKVFQESGIEPL